MADKIADGIQSGGNKYATPKYDVNYRHTGAERGLDGEDAQRYIDQAPDILVCQIKIWDPDKQGIQPAPAKEQCKMVLHEVEDITVNSSYKNVISTASVVIPKGSIIKKVITVCSVDQNTGAQDSGVASDLKNNSPEPKVSKDVSSDSNQADGKELFDPDNVNDFGLVLTTATEKGRPVDPTMFTTGDRIEIRCGYTQDPDVAENIDKYENHKCLNLVFSGFITGISPTQPIELRCEDLAYIFKTISCENIQSKGNRTVADFFEAGGKYNWLEGTGIELHPDVKASNINVGAVNVNQHITVADVLYEWSKSGLLCFMRQVVDGDGAVTYKLCIGRSYMSSIPEGGSKDEPPKYPEDSITYKVDDAGIPIIYSDWDVAEDQLSIMNVDKKFVVIDAVGWKIKNGKNSFCKVSVRVDPEWRPSDGPKKYQFVNEKEFTSVRKGKRKKDGKRSVVNEIHSLKAYSRYPYTSKKWGVTMDELKKEAIAYYENFNPSGVSGKLTLFGGRDIKTSSIIAFVDLREPARQGFYIVEEVNTKFGVNGYRQEVTLPYRVKLFDNFKIVK